MRTVGDGLADLVRGLRDALAEASCVLVTGGLGPTEDDRTREALAQVAGVALAEDPRAWAIVARWFERAGRTPTAMQRRQARLPAGFEPLQNAEGTAPGVVGRVGDRRVFLLPGPPREMRAMFDAEALPRWRTDPGFVEAAARVVWTAGAPEPDVATPLEDLMRADEPTVGTHPDDGEVAVRVLARGARAEARADALRDEILRRLGANVVSTHEERRVQHAVVEAPRGPRALDHDGRVGHRRTRGPHARRGAGRERGVPRRARDLLRRVEARAARGARRHPRRARRRVRAGRARHGGGGAQGRGRRRRRRDDRRRRTRARTSEGSRRARSSSPWRRASRRRSASPSRRRSPGSRCSAARPSSPSIRSAASCGAPDRAPRPLAGSPRGGIARRGVEPRLRDPKSPVLPLHHRASRTGNAT